jgi:hypothetical protein
VHDEPGSLGDEQPSFLRARYAAGTRSSNADYDYVGEVCARRIRGVALGLGNA